MEINLLLLLVLLLLMLVLGAAIGFFYARQRGTEALRISEAKSHSLQEQLLILQGQAEQLRLSNREAYSREEYDGRLLSMLTPLQKQLDLVNRQVLELDQHTTGASEKLFNQLVNDAKSQAELRAATEALNTALRSTSARGNWGEVQLQRILEAAGMLQHVDFDLQQKGSSFGIGSADPGRVLRPDAIIHLPNGGHLAIDAKVPLDSYLKAQAISGSSSEAQAQRDEYCAAHAKALSAHIKELVRRNYPADFPNSPQITILFVPSEALLSTALESDPTLLENSLRNGIVLTSPVSLFALLRSVAAIWASSAATNEAARIVELGRTLISRLEVSVKHLGALGKSLSASVKNYNSAIGSLESRVLITARKFDSIETSGMNLNDTFPEMDSDSAQIRDFVSPEFTQMLAADNAKSTDSHNRASPNQLKARRDSPQHDQ